MRGDRRELRSLLRAAASESRRIGARLGAHDDWQYPIAVALRAYSLAHAEHLPDYLLPHRIGAFAQCVSHQAGLCTRELAPVEPLLRQAETIVWRIRTTLDARVAG